MAGLKSTNTTQYKAKQSVSTTCIIQDIYTQYEGVGTNTTQYKAKQSVSTTCIIQDIYTQYEGVGRGK